MKHSHPSIVDTLTWILVKQPFSVRSCMHAYTPSCVSAWVSVSKDVLVCSSCGIVHVCSYSIDNESSLHSIMAVLMSMGVATIKGCVVVQDIDVSLCSVSGAIRPLIGSSEEYNDTVLYYSRANRRVRTASVRPVSHALVDSSRERGSDMDIDRQPSKRRKITADNAIRYARNLSMNPVLGNVEVIVRVLRETLVEILQSHLCAVLYGDGRWDRICAFVCAVLVYYGATVPSVVDMHLLINKALVLQSDSALMKRISKWMAPSVDDCVVLKKVQSISDELCRESSDIFIWVFRVLQCTGNSRRTPPLDRIRETVVGILYLLKKGVVVNDIVLINPIASLGSVLPDPSSVSETIHVKSKVITDTENNFKALVRTLNIKSVLF
jgi:hypothetical protein